MTSKEWNELAGDIYPCTDIIADLAAVERERDEALRDVKQLHDAAVETEDNLDALKADCCATHEADNARCIKLEARVKVMEEASEGCQAEAQCGCDGCKRIRVMHAALAGKEDVGVIFTEGSDGEWTCSGCGMDWVCEAETPEVNEYRYCPKCGKQVMAYEHFKEDGDG